MPLRRLPATWPERCSARWKAPSTMPSSARMVRLDVFRALDEADGQGAQRILAFLERADEVGLGRAQQVGGLRRGRLE